MVYCRGGGYVVICDVSSCGVGVEYGGGAGGCVLVDGVSDTVRYVGVDDVVADNRDFGVHVVNIVVITSSCTLSVCAYVSTVVSDVGMCSIDIVRNDSIVGVVCLSMSLQYMVSNV